jgi:hypothetical protein
MKMLCMNIKSNLLSAISTIVQPIKETNAQVDFGFDVQAASQRRAVEHSCIPAAIGQPQCWTRVQPHQTELCLSFRGLRRG